MLIPLSQARISVLCFLIAIGCLTTVLFVFHDNDGQKFFRHYKDLIVFSDVSDHQIATSLDTLPSKTEALISNTDALQLSESSAPPTSTSSALPPLSTANITSLSNDTKISNATSISDTTSAVNVTDTPPLFSDGSLTYGNMTSSPRILQTSMIFKGMNNEISDRCLQSHLDHGFRHGYKMSTLRTEFMMIKDDENENKKRGEFSATVWDKPLYLLSTLIEELAKPADERAEWIVYVDADTILLNPSIPWSTFLPPASFPNQKIHFLGSHDWSSFNAGVFMIRVHPWSVRLLNTAIAIPTIRPDINLYNCIDQNAIKWVLMSDEFKDHAIYQPSHWWNGIAYPWKGPHPMPKVKNGDMLVHFAGAQKGHNKTEEIGKWLDGKAGPQKRNMTVEKTGYQKEVKEFWENHTGARKALGDAAKFFKQDFDKDARKTVWTKQQALEESKRDFFYEEKKIRQRTKELIQAIKSEEKKREKNKNGKNGR